MVVLAAERRAIVERAIVKWTVVVRIVAVWSVVVVVEWAVIIE